MEICIESREGDFIAFREEELRMMAV